MTPTIAWTTLIATLIATATISGHDNAVVAIRLKGHFFSEPATVNLTAVVEPDAQNRLLRLEVESDRYSRVSEMTLLGERDRRLHSLELKDLPAGIYVLRAEVRSREALRGQARYDLVVSGPDRR